MVHVVGHVSLLGFFFRSHGKDRCFGSQADQAPLKRFQVARYWSKGKHWSKRKRVGQKGQHWSKTIVHQKEALVVYIAAATCALSNVHCQRTQRPWSVQTQQNHFPETRQQAGPGLVPAVVVDAADAFAHYPVATVVVFRVAGLEQSAQQPTE